MLKPTDIVALWMATKLIITQSEKRAYLSWTREVFEGQCKLNQLRSDGCAITVVGKDLNTFTQAMRSWDYRPCGLRLLIVVKHPTMSPQQHFRKCQSFLESISQRYSWTFGSDVAPDRIRGSSWVKEVDSQIIVMFTTRNTRIELDEFWTDNLLVTQQDGQIIRIQNVSEESDGLHNYTWYTNFHSPNPSISKSPFSHNTLSGVIKVLRAYGEGDKLLLSCSKFKAWTYIAAKDGIQVTVEVDSG